MEKEKEVVMVDVEGENDEEGRGKEWEAVKWERLLPKMPLRVLLVEADDSTRHIIAAHLRKCNYKVAAISDGLKAWEILKQRHNNIDLVLTELDLPSISGYALLSLIMEHDGCKNIPVIVMSSQDSISMVLNCMLKGATDFLIKPVRRNELKNLWRHVWRIFTMNVNSPQYMVNGQCKLEAAFENHLATCHSSDNVSSDPKKNVAGERASDSQDLSQMNNWGKEAGPSHKEMENMKSEELVKDSCGPKHKTTVSSSEREHRYNEASVSTALREAENGMDSGVATEDGIASPGSQGHRDNNANDHELLREPSCEARDFIVGINKQNCTIEQTSLSRELNNHNPSPALELSLRRSSDEAEIQEEDERHILNHTSASAFSWYNNNKNINNLFPSCGGDLTKTNGATNTYAYPKEFYCSGENKLNVHGETESSDHAHLPGVMSNGGGGQTSCDSTLKPVFSPISAFQKEDSPFLTSPLYSDTRTHSSTQGCGTTVDNFTEQALLHEPETRESVEKHGSKKSLVDHAIGSSTTPSNNDFATHSEVIDANPMSAPDAVGTSTGEESARRGDNCGNTVDQLRPKMGHHSAEREAALAKFRLKRKDRCYEKKVRYQSRKRLAELRPRVKGQFVRQPPNDQTAC